MVPERERCGGQRTCVSAEELEAVDGALGGAPTNGRRRRRTKGGFRTKKEAAEYAASQAAPLRGRVEFDHVSFSYDPDRPLITDLSLVAEPGRTVAIVGPTGAGKTTLVNLIMRFYELDGGRITLDGQDIAKMPRAELRSNIGMVLQDTWMFEGTIRDNIAYGNPDATEEQILDAARATYVDRFVHALPDGYDTIVDDESGAISTGEKQLLTIARAFLSDPTILILDEATSSVDTRTEVLAPGRDGGDPFAADELRDRPPALDDPQRRRHPRDGGREHRRAGTPHRPARERRRVRQALYNAQFAAPVVDESEV